MSATEHEHEQLVAVECAARRALDRLRDADAEVPIACAFTLLRLRDALDALDELRRAENPA